MQAIDIVRQSLSAALLSAMCFTTSPTLAADRISTRVEVFGPLGIHVLTLRTVVDESPGRYALTIDYETVGLAELVADQRSHAQATGRIDGVLAIPELFRAETRRNGTEFRDRLQYGRNGEVTADSTPSPETPIAEALVRGTVDNLTAHFRLDRQVSAKKTCALMVAVFDGRHRYDLLFADAGVETLTNDSGQEFDGPAIACRMRRQLREADSSEVEGARQGTIWYAPLLAGGIAVPIRMTLETQIGTVRGFLAELHGPGSDLLLLK